MSLEVFPLGSFLFAFYTFLNMLALGAGQDVGRSCIILKILDKNIMLDCGLHMGFSDNRKYPDFTKMTSSSLNFYFNLYFQGGSGVNFFSFFSKIY